MIEEPKRYNLAKHQMVGVGQDPLYPSKLEIHLSCVGHISPFAGSSHSRAGKVIGCFYGPVVESGIK